jgi:exosortase A
MTAMPLAVVARPRWHGPSRRLAPLAAVMLAALAAMGALFHAEIAAAVRVWRDSTAYGHCFLIIPIALWLAWDRRDAARGLPLRPTALPALAVPPLAVAWLLAERLGLMEGRQLAALGMAGALLVALLGWRLARVFAAALLYLAFLVPFGSFLVPTLQSVTAWFVDAGLEMLGIPHVVDDFVIDIPEGSFYVAEACAGLRFLVAALAFGALYGCLIYRSPWKRLAFLIVSCVVPVAANGIRALGIVVTGHLIGDAEAAAADHLIYGWGFFSAVILLLTLAGLPFRDDRQPLPARAGAPEPWPPAQGRAAVTAAAAVTLLAAAAPTAAALLDRTGPAPHLDLPGFLATADCVAIGPWDATAARFDCGGVRLTATLAVLPAGSSPAALRAARSRATGERDAADAVTSVLTADGVRPASWRLVELREPDRLTATAAWIDGDPDRAGLAGRARQAWDSILGTGTPPVLVAAALEPPTMLRAADHERATRTLAGFLRAQGPLLAAVAAAGRLTRPEPPP